MLKNNTELHFLSEKKTQHIKYKCTLQLKWFLRILLDEMLVFFVYLKNNNSGVILIKMLNYNHSTCLIRKISFFFCLSLWMLCISPRYVFSDNFGDAKLKKNSIWKINQFYFYCSKLLHQTWNTAWEGIKYILHY